MIILSNLMIPFHITIDVYVSPYPCCSQISGRAAECQMAEEILRSVVDSICTRTITVRQPGAARFLVEQEGSSILAEMQAKFQVHICMDKVHWEPLEDEVNTNVLCVIIY